MRSPVSSTMPVPIAAPATISVTWIAQAHHCGADSGRDEHGTDYQQQLEAQYRGQQAALHGPLTRLETFAVQVMEVRRLHDTAVPPDCERRA
jgi:hypothetical protein